MWCAAAPTCYRYGTDAGRSTACGGWSTPELTHWPPPASPIGWGADRAGRRKRLYDRPRTLLDRLLDTDALTDAQKDELTSYRYQLDPAAVTCRTI